MGDRADLLEVRMKELTRSEVISITYALKVLRESGTGSYGVKIDKAAEALIEYLQSVKAEKENN